MTDLSAPIWQRAATAGSAVKAIAGQYFAMLNDAAETLARVAAIKARMAERAKERVE